jgi:chromosome segregation ATPase
VARQHQEAIEREDSLQAQLASHYDLTREFRAKIGDLEESLSSSERQKKSLEGRYESLNEHYRELMASKQGLEKSCTSMELQINDLTNKVNDEQDQNILQKEQLRAMEQLLKVTQIELEGERKQSELSNQEKAILEVQIKELQLKLLDSETSSNGVSSRVGRRPSAAYHQILSQIESESTEKQALLKETRRQERQIRDLTNQLADRDRLRISLEESLDKCELRLRKLQTAVESAEIKCGELEGVKRRLERDVGEERDKGERLMRECEKLKSRQFRASGDL